MTTQFRTTVTLTNDSKNKIIERHGSRAAIGKVVNTEWLSYLEIAKHGVNLAIDTFTLQDMEDIRVGFHGDIPLSSAVRLILSGNLAAVIDVSLITDRKPSLGPTVSELNTLQMLGLIDCLYLISSDDKQVAQALLGKFTDENDVGLSGADEDDD